MLVLVLLPCLPGHCLAVDKTCNGASHNLKAQIGAFHAASKRKYLSGLNTIADTAREMKREEDISLSPSLPLCGCVTLTTRRPCRACPRNCRSPAARQCADASACDILWLRVSDLKMAAISLVLLECVTLVGPPFPSFPSLVFYFCLSGWLTPAGPRALMDFGAWLMCRPCIIHLLNTAKHNSGLIAFWAISF